MSPNRDARGVLMRINSSTWECTGDINEIHNYNFKGEIVSYEFLTKFVEIQSGYMLFLERLVEKKRIENDKLRKELSRLTNELLHTQRCNHDCNNQKVIGDNEQLINNCEVVI